MSKKELISAIAGDTGLQQVAAGALQITWAQTGAMTMRRRVTGELGPPDDATNWLRNHIAAKGSLRRQLPAR